MSEPRSRPSPSANWEELRRAHLGDRPSPLRRQELLAQLSSLCTPPTLAPPPGPAERLPALGPKRRAKLPVWMLLTAAFVAGGAATLWLEARDRLPLTPEPPAFSVARNPDRGASEAARAKDANGVDRTAALAQQQLAAAMPGGCIRARGDDGLLNDFERPIAPGSAIAVEQRDGRTGEWFHLRNTSGMDAQPEPLRIVGVSQTNTGDQKALQVAGPARVGWGANAGIRFEQCYDASAYAGIEFRARGKGGVFVGLQTLDSVPVELGGRCTSKCWFTGGRYLVLTEQFTTYRIRWQDLSPPDPTYDMAKELLQLMFSVQSGPEPYEFWVDDLRLLRRDE